MKSKAFALFLTGGCLLALGLNCLPNIGGTNFLNWFQGLGS